MLLFTFVAVNRAASTFLKETASMKSEFVMQEKKKQHEDSTMGK